MGDCLCTGQFMDAAKGRAEAACDFFGDQEWRRRQCSLRRHRLYSVRVRRRATSRQPRTTCKFFLCNLVSTRTPVSGSKATAWHTDRGLPGVYEAVGRGHDATLSVARSSLFKPFVVSRRAISFRLASLVMKGSAVRVRASALKSLPFRTRGSRIPLPVPRRPRWPTLLMTFLRSVHLAPFPHNKSSGSALQMYSWTQGTFPRRKQRD